MDPGVPIPEDPKMYVCKMIIQNQLKNLTFTPLAQMCEDVTSRPEVYCFSSGHLYSPWFEGRMDRLSGSPDYSGHPFLFSYSYGYWRLEGATKNRWGKTKELIY